MKNVKNKVTVRSFFEISKLNCSEFLSYLPNKKNVILDFGCGNGIFPKNFSNKKIKLVNMYDKNKKLKTHIKKKYKKNSLIKWTPTININYNVVFINSTVQYLTLKNYKSLISYFFKKKVDMIIISDIPKYPFYLEAFFCIFINLSRILISFKYLFQKNYNFYSYKNKINLIIKNRNYKYELDKNINEDKLLRYTLIFRKIVPNK
tara:strand:- start:327 stop:941 length:615 start_codon:yes stop_codon:yes gene_type:complete